MAPGPDQRVARNGQALQSGERLLFVGDSNTDTERCTRARPLGYGFVMMVDALLRAARPELGFELANCGVDGDTVLDLARRWETDVLAARPDRLFVMIGTNDVGYRYLPDYHARAVDDASFLATLARLVRLTQAALPTRIVLIEPPLFELPLDADPNRAIRAIGASVADLAARTGCGLIALQDSMAAALAAGHAEGWFQNVNHLAFRGHALLALHVMRVLGWSLAASE